MKKVYLKIMQYLLHSFEWGADDDYYSDVCKNLLRNSGVTLVEAEAAGYLNPPDCPTNDRLQELHDMISAEFMWSDTPQGHGYWSAVLVKIASRKRAAPDEPEVDDDEF